MIPRGPESDEDRALREWFNEQRTKNLDRLEEGAKALAQLVTGLYSVLFAILAFSSDPVPAYLRDPLVRWLGSIAVGVVGGFIPAFSAVRMSIVDTLRVVD